MHSNFLDKRRRHLRLQPNQVDNVLPEHFGTSYPKFIQLLKYYYEFQAEERSTELLSHMFATRDITETDITLLSYIEDELLLGDSYFESFAEGDAQKRAAANFSNTLFRSKGTKFAIQWFFRSFFGIDVEIVETQEQVFKLNDTQSGIGSNSIRFLTDDKLYQTFAYLIRSSVPIVKWKDLFKLFVHPAGMYLGGELLVSDRVFASMIAPQLVGKALPIDQFYLQVIQIANGNSTAPTEFYQWGETIAPDGYRLLTPSLSGDSVKSIDALIYARIAAGAATREQEERWFNTVLPSLQDQPWYRENYQLYSTTEGVVNRRKNSVYATYVEPSITENEGTEFRVRLVGEHVPGRSGTYEYYIDKNTTNIADFEYGTALPDSNNRQLITMANDSASLYIKTFADSDESESAESFTVHFFDDEHRNVASQSITINDVDASYTLTPSSTSIDEGDSVQFTIAGIGVPNGGSTTLQYQVIPTALDSADSADFVATTWTSDFTPIDIRNDSGRFSVQTKVDGDQDSEETFIVKLYTGSNILKATSPLITLNNKVPTFAITKDGSNTATITEGDNVVVELTVDATTVGTTVNYTIGGTDPRIITKTGSFVITSTQSQYILSATETSDVFETVAGQVIDLTTSSGGFFNPERTQVKLLRVENQTQSFIITPSVVGAQNGDNLNFNITGTNIQDGVRAGYFIDHVTTTDADFSTPPPTTDSAALPITFTSNLGTAPFILANNGDSDNEDFVFVLTNTSGDEQGRLGYTIIGDYAYTMTTPNGGNANEGQTIESIFTTSAADGLYYYYIAGTVDSNDFSDGWAPIDARQSFIVAGNNGVIDLTLNNDQRRETNETFRIYVSDTPSGATLASTGDITLYDTSVPLYTMTVPTGVVIEGQTLSITVNPSINNNGSENVYVNFKTISGDSADIITPQPIAQSISDQAVVFSTPIGVKDSATGGLTVQATAHVGSYTGTLVTSGSIVVADATSSYTLATNATDDSASEGDTIQFSFNGTNVPTATYYYNVSDVKPKATTSTTFSGSQVLYVPHSNLTLGMEIRGTIPYPTGTVITSFGSGNLVYVSNANTLPVNASAGTSVYFALPEVWADFGASSNKPFGEFSHTTSSVSQFNVDIATDGDLPQPRIENYTMNVTSSFGASAVKTKAFTIGDMTISNIPEVQIPPVLTNPQIHFDIGSNSDLASITLDVNPVGDLRVNGFAAELAGIPTIDYGDWVDDIGAAFVAGNFEIKATLVSSFGTNAGSPGDFGVWNDLDITRSWNVESGTAPSGGVVSVSEEISFTIREKANTSNAVTFVQTLTASTIDIDPINFP